MKQIVYSAKSFYPGLAAAYAFSLGELLSIIQHIDDRKMIISIPHAYDAIAGALSIFISDSDNVFDNVRPEPVKQEDLYLIFPIGGDGGWPWGYFQGSIEEARSLGNEYLQGDFTIVQAKTGILAKTFFEAQGANFHKALGPLDIDFDELYEEDWLKGTLYMIDGASVSIEHENR